MSEDGDPLSLSNTEASLNKVGIALRKDKDTFRDFGDVLNDLKNKWSTLSQVDQADILKSLAGTRQRNILQALLGNMEDLKNMQDAVTTSAGSAQKKFDEAYGQSLDAKINDLKHSFETLYDSMMNSEAFKKILDGLTKAFNDLSKSQILKDIANGIANIIALLANMGSTGVSQILTLLITLKALKTAFNLKTEFNAIATGLDVIAIKGGLFKQLYAILSGTATVTKEISVASKVATGVMVTETVAVGGLNGAFLLLGTSIKTALTSMVAFALTPQGMAIIGIGLAIAGVTYAIGQHNKAQEELKAKVDANVTSVNNLTQSMQELNQQGIKDNLKPLEDEQTKLQDLIKKKQDAVNRLKELGVNDYTTVTSNATGNMVTDTNNQEQVKLRATIEQTSIAIEKETDALDKSNTEYDKNTGAIKKVTDAKDVLKNMDVVSSIKEQTKAEMDNTSMQEEHKKQFDDYLSSLQSSYDTYTKLSSAENLSAEDKKRLSSVVSDLTGKVSGLTVVVDQDGKTRIVNNGLIESQIAMFKQEGVSVETLTSIRLSDAKQSSSIQVGMTQMTYSQIKQRIAYYQAEAQAILASTATVISALNLQQQAKANANQASSGDELDMARAEHLGLVRAGYATQEANSMQSYLDAIDKIYSNSLGGGISAPSGGGFTPSSSGNGGSSKGSGSSAKQDVADLIDKADRYLNLKNVIDDLNASLEKNKSLQDATTSTSEKIALQQQEVDLLNKKKDAENNLYAEQLKQKSELGSWLTDAGFNIDNSGILLNYRDRFEQLKIWANSASGSIKEERQGIFKLVEDNINTYDTLVHSTMATTQKDIASVNKLQMESAKAKYDITNNGTNYQGKVNEYNLSTSNITKEQYYQNKTDIANANLKASYDYLDELNKRTPQTQQGWADLGAEISNVTNTIQDQAKAVKDAEKEQSDYILNTVTDVEKQITDIIKKEVEVRKQAIDDEKNTRIKAINDAKDAYNKVNSETDYSSNLNKEQQKLLEIKSQITNISRDTSRTGQLQLQKLLNDAKTQQDVIDKLVLDHQRQLNNDTFDAQTKAIEDQATAQKNALDTQYSDANIQQMVTKALSTGVIQDINGKLVSIKDFYITWVNQFGDGLSLTGQKIKSELISKLEEAQKSASNLNTILKDLGFVNIANVDTESFSNIQTSLSQIDVASILPPMQTSMLPISTYANSVISNSKTPINITMNQPFAVFNGDVNKDSIDDVQNMINKAMDDFKNMFKNQLQLQGIY